MTYLRFAGPAVVALLLSSTALTAPGAASTHERIEIPLDASGSGWATVTVTVAQETTVRLGVLSTVEATPVTYGYANLVLTGDTATTLHWLLSGGNPRYNGTFVDAGPITFEESTDSVATPSQALAGATFLRVLPPGTHTLVQFFAWAGAGSITDAVMFVEGDGLTLDATDAGPEAAMFEDRDFNPAIHQHDSTGTDYHDVMALGQIPYAFTRSTTAFLTVLGPPSRHGDALFGIDGPYTCPAYPHNLLLRGAPTGSYQFSVLAHATVDPKGTSVGPVTVLPIHMYERPILLVADLPIPEQTESVHLPVTAPCAATGE